MGCNMGLFDNLKAQAMQLADQLGLDDKLADGLENLVDKLEGFQSQGKLDDIAQNALASFKPALEKFKATDELEALLEKAKDFVEKLSTADLPGNLEEIVTKVKGYLK